jgi:YD repeat-containing protein
MNYRLLTLGAMFLSLIAKQAVAQRPSLGNGPTDSKLTPSVARSGGTGIGSIFSPNLYNGNANVNIPIYDYPTENGNFGISLGYNTAGVKVSEMSGSIGHHFSLNAAGTISRVLKDMPDEMNSYELIPVGGGDCFSSFCMGVKGKFATHMGGANAPFSNIEQSRYKDGESDDFVVSVGGLAFTFNIGANGFTFTHPHRNVKVELLLNGNPVSQMPALLGAQLNHENISFKITDEQGVQYFFSDGIKESRTYIDNPTDNGLVFTILYVSQWVINKIVLADGTEVKYNYHTREHKGRAGTYIAFESIEEVGYSLFRQEVKGDAQAFYVKQIASIDYPNNVKATFVYDPSSYARCDNPGLAGYPTVDEVLKEIKISEGGDNNCRRYSFERAYSVAPGSNPNTPAEIPYGGACQQMGDSSYAYHRLILKGIRMISCDGLQSEPFYSFVYDVLRLPSRYSGAQDYFGYYNGVAVTEFDGMMTIPQHYPPSGPQYGVNKNHNSIFAAAGILRTVKNAYGGEINFDYEGHSLTNPLTGLPVSDPLFMGVNADDGVRVKSITLKDKYYPGSFLKQEFTYAGGQRFLTGGYFHYPYANANSRAFAGIYVSPHQLVNGSNHGYSTVTVTSKDQSGNQLSRSVTDYTNFYDPATGVARYYLNGGNRHYYQQPFADRQYIRDWEMGLPLKQEEYDQHNNIISRSTNVFTHSLDNTSTIGKVENIKTLRYVNSDVEIVSEPYRPYTGKSFLMQTTIEKFIDNNTSISDIVTYEYDGKDNLSKTITTNSLGEKTVSVNVYNYNVSGPGVAGGNQTSSPLYAMTAAGIEKVVSMERWIQGTTNLPYTNMLLDASITGYQYQNGKLWPKNMFMLQAGDPLTYTAYTGIATGSPIVNPFAKIQASYSASTVAGFIKASEVMQFDSKGRPIETYLPEQNMYKSMIWDAASGRKVAEAGNARYADVGYCSFESTLYDNIAYTGTETIHEGNFVYNLCGMSASDAITGGVCYRFTGQCTSVSSTNLTPGKEYIVTFWSKNGIPALSGAGLGTIPCTSMYSANGWTFYRVQFTAGSAAAITFSGSSSVLLDEVRLFPVGASMISSTFVPLSGTTSSTDATGRITKYEYDSFGRLVLSRNQESHIISKTEYHVGQ